MNARDEERRISNLPIDKVKIELHELEKKINLRDGGISSLNLTRLMLQIRLRELNEHL